MMYLKFLDKDYRGCSIDIQPKDENEIRELRNMVRNSLVIENPMVTFAENYKSGMYASEEEASEDAYLAEKLSALWDGNAPWMNVMMLLARAMQSMIDSESDDNGSDAPDGTDGFMDVYEDPFPFDEVNDGPDDHVEEMEDPMTGPDGNPKKK